MRIGINSGPLRGVVLEFEQNPGGYSIAIPVEGYCYDVRVYNNGHAPAIEEISRAGVERSTSLDDGMRRYAEPTISPEEFDRVLSAPSGLEHGTVSTASSWATIAHPEAYRIISEEMPELLQHRDVQSLFRTKPRSERPPQLEVSCL
jgi:hypothetical protein